MKTCTKCKVEKTLEEFGKRADSLDGTKGICKNCYNTKCREKYRDINNNPTLLENERYCKQCTNIKSCSDFNIHFKRKDGLQIRCKICQPIFEREQSLKREEKRKSLGREHFRLKDLNYRNKHREKVRQKRRIGQSNRLKEDTLYRIKHNVMSSINQYLDSPKTKKTVEILGCSIKEFKNHIELQFESWMNWENRGRYTGNYSETWQIDHKIPISSAKNEEEVYKLSHYSNLQPLCSRLNLEKGNKINN